jgi:VWFA-related protein
MRATMLFVAALGSLTSMGAQIQSGETFKAGVTMIQVPVVVRDHDGHVVGNLSKDDFQLFDDGKRQEIASFSMEGATQVVPDRSLPDAKAATAPNTGGTGMAIPTRFVTYFFDDLIIRDQGDLKRIRDAATQQLGALQPGDRAAIFTSSCRVELEFTTDARKLQETVGRMQLRPVPVCRVSRSQTLQVELLKAVVNKMSNLPGRREIILTSSGFHIGPSRPYEESELIEAATRAKVLIDAVDTGEATDFTGGGAASAAGSNQPWYDATNPVVLEDLAHGTGGTYVTGNDFALSFRKLATPESHYVLGFVPAGKADGRFHQLKVKLENAHKLTVDARKGYYAAPPSE